MSPQLTHNLLKILCHATFKLQKQFLTRKGICKPICWTNVATNVDKISPLQYTMKIMLIAWALVHFVEVWYIWLPPPPPPPPPPPQCEWSNPKELWVFDLFTDQLRTVMQPKQTKTKQNCLHILWDIPYLGHNAYRQTSNISCRWLQWIGQRQLQSQTRNT